MRAGELKYKLELLEPRRTTDRMGAEYVQYVKTRTVHAERVDMSGNISEEVGEHFPDYTVRFNIRSKHPVDENWRVRQIRPEGHLYTVTAIIPNLDKDYVILQCVRTNE